MSRPFEQRADRPFKNLSEVHHAGRAGLNSVFRPGTLWEYGPFTEGTLPTIVRVAERGAYTSGENYSKQPEDSCALGNPTWYIRSEIVFCPFGAHETGEVTGLPPRALVPHLPGDVAAELREIIEEQREEIHRANKDRAKWQARASAAEAKLALLRKALQS